MREITGSSDSFVAKKRSGATLYSRSWNLPGARSDFTSSGTCTSRPGVFRGFGQVSGRARQVIADRDKTGSSDPVFLLDH
jgi:hypothetical protein